MLRLHFDVRPSLQVVAIAAAGVLVFLTAFAHDQWTHYREEVAQAERDVRSTAVLLAEHTSQTFDAAEETLHVVAGLRDVATEKGYDAAKIHELLKAIRSGSPLFRSIAWTDALGNVIASSSFADPTAINIADREAFQFWREAAPLDLDGLHVSAPLHSPALDSWVILVSVRTEGSDGRFNGVVVGAVDPDYFSRVYRRVELGPSRIVTTFRDDGTILAREPSNRSLLGTSVAGRRFMTEIVPSAPAGTFDGQGLGDGIDRLIGYAVAPGNGFIVTVATPRDVALADFWRGLVVASVRVGLTALAIFAGTAYLVWQMRRREQIEREMIAREDRFRDLASLSGDWFWETDEQHRFVWLSGPVETAAGLPAPWQGGEAAQGGPPADEAGEAQVQALREHRPFRDFEYRQAGPTGDRWLKASGVPIFAADGRFRGYRGAVKDVTALKRAEQTLRDAVEAIPGGVLLFDEEGRLAYVNANSATLLPEMVPFDRIGDTFETIVRRVVAAGLIRDADDDPEAWIAWRVQRHRSNRDSVLVRYDSRVVEVIERTTSGGSTMVLRFDVTDRERARTAEGMAREAADAANRAKSDFLSRMSHELRSPLNAVIGFGELLQGRNPKSPEVLSEYADYIVQAGRHLLNLVDEVLDISGIEAGRLQLSLKPVALASALRQAVRTMQPVAEQTGITLDVEIGPDAPVVLADPQRLRQVVINLLSNAIKYNRPAGSVSVRVEAAGEWARISVTDTGAGIPADRQDQLFEPFQRLGAEFTDVKGTGIGLALSKRLVEAMNGRITFESEPGQGTTFRVDLLFAPPLPAVVEPESSPGEALVTDPGGYSVLYIEDSPANLALVQYVVETLPSVAMLSARSGKEGLDLARAERPNAILLDLQLPDMNGFEVLERLQADPMTSTIPVIALTASAMPSEVNRGLAAGFFRYLTKPLNVEQMLAALEAATRGLRVSRHEQADLQKTPPRSAARN